MKTRIYLRVAKNGYKSKVDASIKSNNAPLHLTGYRNEKTFLPTIAFAVDFEIPDELFSNGVKVIGEINVTKDKAVLAAQIPKPDLLETNKK
jgi:hypothetical protein